MADKISASVGKGGKNLEDDVLLVQQLLNQHASGAGFSKLKESGQCDSSTLKAIIKVQEAIGMKSPDGRIEPGKTTFQAIAARKLPVPEAAPAATAGKGGGKLVGKTSGVNSRILDFAGAVADFYGKDIKVVSGKRSAEDQAGAMWRNWTKTLKRGKIYKVLQSNSKLLDQLDGLYKTGMEDKSASAKDREAAEAEFRKIIVGIGGKISLHLSGEAIDVDPSCMTAAMRQAMQTGLFELAEGKDGKACFHYDTRDGAPPVVNDALKKKWKAP